MGLGKTSSVLHEERAATSGEKVIWAYILQFSVKKNGWSEHELVDVEGDASRRGVGRFSIYWRGILWRLLYGNEDVI